MKLYEIIHDLDLSFYKIKTKSDARRIIEQGGITVVLLRLDDEDKLKLINEEKVTDPKKEYQAGDHLKICSKKWTHRVKIGYPRAIMLTVEEIETGDESTPKIFISFCSDGEKKEFGDQSEYLFNKYFACEGWKPTYKGNDIESFYIDITEAERNRRKNTVWTPAGKIRVDGEPDVEYNWEKLD